MSTTRKNPLSVIFRLFWLGWELSISMAEYLARYAFRKRGRSRLERAAWLQKTCRKLLKPLRLEIKTVGQVPASGLMVSNHLSYIDIIVLCAITPCVFVAKNEVKYWPVFGWFAILAGTLFVRRDKRVKVTQSTNEIDAALSDGALLVLFPEGTSSGGETVLPFKSSLLEPATRQTHRLTACHVGYELADGDVSEEVCYWKDMTLVPHLVNLVSKGTIGATVSYAAVPNASSDRKELARQLHAEVLGLKNGASVTVDSSRPAPIEEPATV